jgi:hypothetical protein
VTESDWWALCDADPGAFPWHALGDWFEERADPRADAAREVGRRGWVPHRYAHWPEYCRWWRYDPAVRAAGPFRDDLPAEAFDRLPAAVEDVSMRDRKRVYRSPSAACAALLDALARAPPPC